MIYQRKQWKQEFSFYFYRWSKKTLAKITKLWDEIEHLIETINEDKQGEYEKDFLKIKFNSDDNVHLNKMLKIHMLMNNC